MIRLAVDKKKCVNCGNCEAWLPDLMKHSATGLLISTKNTSVDFEAIHAAIKSCHLDALALEEV